MTFTKSYNLGYLVRYHGFIYHIKSDDIREVIEQVYWITPR